MNAKFLKWPIIIILFIFILTPSIEAKNRMFDTQFYGLDIAGDYINENKGAGERAMHSKHQAYGLLWHADIKSTRSIPETVKDIQYAEENLNASWIFIYNWDFNIMQDQERWNYIQDNYELKQIAFTQTAQKAQPLYFLLRRGGTFDIDKLNNMIENQTIQTKEYELTRGNVKISYINFDS